jgi:hypothetical protein
MMATLASLDPANQIQRGVRRTTRGRPAVHAVAQAALFILLVALDLRLDVCQGLSPEKIFLVTAWLV